MCLRMYVYVPMCVRVFVTMNALVWVCNLHYTVYLVQFILYSVHCTRESIYDSVYVVYLCVCVGSMCVSASVRVCVSLCVCVF